MEDVAPLAGAGAEMGHRRGQDKVGGRDPQRQSRACLPQALFFWGACGPWLGSWQQVWTWCHEPCEWGMLPGTGGVLLRSSAG
jgi:hypothetical protein